MTIQIKRVYELAADSDGHRKHSIGKVSFLNELRALPRKSGILRVEPH